MNQKSSRGKRVSRKPYSDKTSSVKTKDDAIRSKGKECANDPSWYIREGQLAADVASLSFNNALGAPASINTINDAHFQNKPFAVPGIMAIHTVPCPGISKSAVSPINIAAKNLYSYVRHANSGHSNYDSPDLMLYVMAMDSIFNWIYHLQRVYGIAQVFSQRNRYIGDALIQAMGIIPTTLRQNLANFRAGINMLIVKASVFAVPNTMTLFKRHAWMYSSIFADSPVEKCQMYAYLPSILHEYMETEGAGYLKAFHTLVKQRSSGNNYMTEETPMPWNMALGIGDEMMANLQASEDINIMSGDVLKAYGSENLFRLGLVPENYAVLPIYSEEILDQIHNTVFMGIYPRANTLEPTVDTMKTYALSTFNIIQDPSIGAGNLLFAPACANNPWLGYSSFLDMAENSPSPERVLVATRNMIAGRSSMLTFDNTNYWYSVLDSVGSDICLYATYYYNDPTTGVLTSGGVYTNMSTPVSADLITKIDKFHKAPLCYYGNISGDQFTPGIPYGSIEDFTLVDNEVLSKIHQSAILSMLGVPV